MDKINAMKIIEGKILTGERAAYASRDTEFIDCTFSDGESPLKECDNVKVTHCRFGWKYPLWYCRGVQAVGCEWLEMGRSGMWYTQDISLKNCIIGAPKQFRRCKDIKLSDCTIPRAEETLWHCKGVSLKNVALAGDYFGMDCEDVVLEKVTIDGNYCFDGAKKICARACIFNSRDAFWNCEEVEISDSVIDGEFLGWNSKKLTFINCKIISHQGLCYIDGLKLVNCELYDTDLCFELCKDIDAEIVSEIVSIKNPVNGRIKCKGYGELVLDKDLVEPSRTAIEVGNG